RKSLAALEADELAQRDIHPVFTGDLACQSLPACLGSGLPGMSRIGYQAPCRTGGDNRDELRTVHCSDGRQQRMPGILAHQHRDATDSRVERANIATRLDEPLLVEHAVGGQEYLAMHMPNPGVTSAEARPHHRVVEPALVQLVEADA